ncbi:hypothetical protein LUZ60_003257 [Juncus effusus]|nr:hypothetical protein LUZ60_003257 [Juncus effusus]
MQKMQEKSKKPKPLPARAGLNRQRPFSSSSASSSSTSPPAIAGSMAAPAAGKNVDKLLFKNLVEMVPLVETLMEKKPNPAFTRRASIVHTAAPAQVKKVSNSTPKPITKTKSIPPKNLKTPNGNLTKPKKDSSKISPSSSSRPLLGLARNLKKEREELALLQVQVKDLESKLIEKESALKSAQDSIEEMNLVTETLEETKRQLENKELLVKSASDELYDAKIALADKQAALEKLEWEGKMSSIKVKELEGDVANMNDEISVLMDVFEKFSPTNNNSKSKESESESEDDENEDSSLEIEPISLEDDLMEIDMEKMETEISKYILALEAAKVNPSEESLDVVAQERLRLQALVLSS